MPLMRWEPGAGMLRLRDEFDRLLDRFSRLPELGLGEELGAVTPRLDVYETDKEVVVKADLPGMKKEDLEVTVSEGVLTLKGALKQDEEVKESGYYRRERRCGSFARNVALPASVDADKTQASFRNGVLEIRVPKMAEEVARGKRITVE